MTLQIHLVQVDDVDNIMAAHSSALITSATSRPVSQLSVQKPFLFDDMTDKQLNQVHFVYFQNTFRNTCNCASCVVVFIACHENYENIHYESVQVQPSFSYVVLSKTTFFSRYTYCV